MATRKLSEFTKDPHNPNLGSQRGKVMIESSLKRLGAGRSIVVDKNGAIISGNQTAEAAQALGLEDAIVVPSDGTKLVVVQRTDLDLNEAKARELSIADNRASEVSLTWSPEALVTALDTPNIELSPYFTDGEFEELTVPDEPLPERTIELKPQKFVRVLISVPLESAILAREHFDALGKIDGIEVDYGAN